MPIVPSQARAIQRLVAQLGAEAAREREAAAARLMLLGRRAVEPVLAALAEAGPPRLGAQGRIAALTVLETALDSRTLPAVLRLVEDADPAVGRRAIEALAHHGGRGAVPALAQALRSPRQELRAAAAAGLDRLHRSGVEEALGPLLEILLDEAGDEAARLAALPVISRLDLRERTPLVLRLRGSRSAALAGRLRLLEAELARPRATGAAAALVESLLASPGRPDVALGVSRALRECDGSAVEVIHHALHTADGLLPLRVLCDALGYFRAPASIPVLHRLLERLGRRGRGGNGDDAVVAEAKASVHLALAAMGSRIALYDLREMLEAERPHVAGRLIEAAAAIGDASLIPALAALASRDPAGRRGCAHALAAIAAREGLSRRSRTPRLLHPDHQAALDELWSRVAAARRR